MVSVRKSPNMISTTGRKPVIAAPTPMPVNPASEIGVSSTRSAPNSSTNPERTLKGVPASATSSPKMQTRESRRISSVKASRTACANVSSRSGINVLGNLAGAGIGSVERKLYRGFDFLAGFGSDPLKRVSIPVAVFDEPIGMKLDGIAFRLPVLLFLPGSIVFAIDVSHMVAAVAIGVGLQKRGSRAGARTLHQTIRDFVDGANVLSIDGRCFQAKRGGAAENCSRGGLGIMRVLVIKVVFADVDNRKLPELGQVHHFVQGSLAEGAFSKEADGDPVASQALGGESCAGRNAHAAPDNGVGSKIARVRIGNMHRSALSAAISGFLAQQFGEHAIRRCALRQTVPVPAMRARDVVIPPQRAASADGNGFFPAVQVRQSGHERPRVQLVHLLFEQTDAHHLPVRVQPLFLLPHHRGNGFRFEDGGGHLLGPPSVTGVVTPDIEANTSNTQAKSYFVQPIPRAAVRYSLLTAVVGRGTSSCRPSSIARTISFCIMFTSNQASWG